MNRCEQCGKSIKGFHVVLAYETGSKQFCDHKCADLYAGSRERSGEPPAGSKRDLKADLELFNKATPGPWEFGPIYAGTIAGELDEERDRANRELLNNFREGWPHAIERALELEEELTRCGNTLVELTIALKDDRKRADKAEALARELAEVLLLYEKWEADLLMDNSLWQSASGLPFITQKVWDELVAVQTERNKVLHKAKEVLGDE